MQALRDVIDKATQQIGNAKAVAACLGVGPQRLTDWKNGHRPCPLHVQAQLAELAGIDAKQWVWDQICRQLGRVTAAVLCALALAVAAYGAPGAAGAQGPKG